MTGGDGCYGWSQEVVRGAAWCWSEMMVMGVTGCDREQCGVMGGDESERWWCGEQKDNTGHFIKRIQLIKFPRSLDTTLIY